MNAPHYCTQNAGDCWTCSLKNYGRDCRNQALKRDHPISRPLRDLGDHRGDDARVVEGSREQIADALVLAGYRVKQEPYSYQVTFRFIESTTNVDPGFLDTCAGEYELAEVTDICVAYACRADLSDAHGHTRGKVEPDGSYRLTGGLP